MYNMAEIHKTPQRNTGLLSRAKQITTYHSIKKDKLTALKTLRK